MLSSILIKWVLRYDFRNSGCQHSFPVESALSGYRDSDGEDCPAHVTTNGSSSILTTGRFTTWQLVYLLDGHLRDSIKQADCLDDYLRFRKILIQRKRGVITAE